MIATAVIVLLMALALVVALLLGTEEQQAILVRCIGAEITAGA